MASTSYPRGLSRPLWHGVFCPGCPVPHKIRRTVLWRTKAAANNLTIFSQTYLISRTSGRMWRGHLCLPRRHSCRRLRTGANPTSAETNLGAADTSVRATSSRYDCCMRFLPLLLTLTAFGQNAPHIGDWKPDAGEPSLQPKGPCAALNSLTGYDLSVITAESLHVSGGPEFCRVLLLVQPEIRIEVSLPAN